MHTKISFSSNLLVSSIFQICRKFFNFFLCRKFLTTTSSLKHGMEVGSALPTTSTGFYNDPYIKSEKDTHLENSETATTALWWWTWTEVGDESWFLETSWETPEYSGDTSRNLWTWFKLPSRSFSLSFWGIKNLTSLIYCKYSFPQVQAFPRPQVRHVGLQAPEALQVTVLTFAFRLFVHLECISFKAAPFFMHGSAL